MLKFIKPYKNCWNGIGRKIEENETSSRMCSAIKLIANAVCSPFRVKDMIIRPSTIRISNKADI